jgi:hypothetical protein
MRFGKLPLRRAATTLPLSNYLRPSYVPSPAVWAWERAIPYGVLGNSELGDCVPAACAHLELNWRVVTNQPIEITDEQVIADYSAVGNYVPGDPASDRGCVMIDAMHFGLRTGFVGRPPWQTFASLDVQNTDQIKVAVYTFGGAIIGFVVPQSMADEINSGTDPTWKSIPNDKPSGEGHCVTVLGYGRSGLAVVSWGKIYRTSWNFWLQWVDEAYCCISKDWLRMSGIAPATGLDLDGLIQDQDVLLRA